MYRVEDKHNGFSTDRVQFLTVCTFVVNTSLNAMEMCDYCESHEPDTICMMYK